MTLETTTISAVPDALPLDGTERIILDQNGQTRDAPVSAVVGLVTPDGIGAELEGAAAAALEAHVGFVNPHEQYALKTELEERLLKFRDASTTFHVSKSIYASDSNTGTSLIEPFLSGEAAIAAARAHVAANPGALVKIKFRPGRYTATQLPWRTGPDVYVRGAGQRTTILIAGPGQELKEFFALDSGAMVEGFTVTGLQAVGTNEIDFSAGQRGYAFAPDGLANNGQGVFLKKSPYVKDCCVINSSQGDGLAGSISTGQAGGAWLVDAAKFHPDSPIKSMVAYGLTAICLNGPGFFVKGLGAYSDLVSCFGIFCSSHVQVQDGGEATLSGGGVSQFGLRGLVADGYSSVPIFTGTLRAAASSGDIAIDVINLTQSAFGQSNKPAQGHLFLLGGNRYVVQSSTPIDATGGIVAETSANKAGYKVEFFNETGIGLVASAAQGAAIDFRKRSTINAGMHFAQGTGAGCNYLALPQNGGAAIPGRGFVERNGGKVYGVLTTEVGDFIAGGGVFRIDGITGAPTIDGSKLSLSNLLSIGPFSRNGGASPVGVGLNEVSNSGSLLNSLGLFGDDTAPTQFAVATYCNNNFLRQVTRTAGQPIEITLTSGVSGNGLTALSQNIELSMNVANGLVRLDSNSLIPAALLPGFVDDILEFADFASLPPVGEQGKLYVAVSPGRKLYRWSGSGYQETSPSPGSTDEVAEGLVNQYFNNARARAAISVSGSLQYDPITGIISYTQPSQFNPSSPGAIGGTAPAPGTFTRLQLPAQSQIPSQPSSGFSLYASAANALSWIGPSGFTIAFDGTSNTNNRSYLLPDQSGTLALAENVVSAATARSPSLFFAGPTSGQPAAPTFRAITSTDLPSSLHSLEQSVTASGGVFTLDASTATYFRASAPIAGNTTISFFNLASLPAGRIQHYLFIFSYTNGAITLSAPGYTFARSGSVPASAGTYAMVITASGNSTVLLVNYGSAHT